MSTIRDYVSSSYYDDNTYNNARYNANSFLSGINISSTESFSLSDYAAIKNGSYGKLLKAYYKQQDTEKNSSSKDTTQRLTLIQSSANSLSQSVRELMKASLWEKKTKSEKDPSTGEEKQTNDYDWNAITKAVKSFVDNYNDTIEEAGKLNTKGVLRNASWMTGVTDSNSKLLLNAGITIGKGNKLELDEDTLKQADIGTLKLLFGGRNSYAGQVAGKADGISMAAVRAGGTYTGKATYSDTLSSIVSSRIDKEI